MARRLLYSTKDKRISGSRVRFMLKYANKNLEIATVAARASNTRF
jgi:hypothetical protein